MVHVKDFLKDVPFLFELNVYLSSCIVYLKPNIEIRITIHDPRTHQMSSLNRK